MFKICEGKDVAAEFERQKCKNSVGMRGEGPFKDERNYCVSCTYEEDGKIHGYGLATIYQHNSIERCNQWNFGGNRKRQIWIDDLWSVKNVGKEIMNKLEDIILKKIDIDKLERKNIYIMALGSASGFYHSLGYEEINFSEDDEDEDDPYVFSECAELKIWMAKSINTNSLDNETIFNLSINEWYFGNCLQRNRLDLLQKILNFTISNYKYLHTLEKLNDKELELEKLDDFQSGLVKYFSDGNFEPIKSFFNNPLSKEMIDNYYLN
jgi:hypothetical protein